MNVDVLSRLEDLEQRLGAVEHTLEELVGETPTSVVEPAPEPAVVYEQPEPEFPSPLGPTWERPSPWRPRLDTSKLLGAQALAWAGGAVSVLGVVFLFALAVQRGWIGPATRVMIGALASAVLFGAGIWVRRRYGLLYAALGAVGAGIAGAYATLLATAVRYDFVSDPVALAIAVGIAGLATALALVWSSELVAGIGLVGSLAVPPLLAIDSNLTQTSLWFAALVVAGAAIVGLARRWDALLALASGIGAIEIVVLLASHGAGTASYLVLAASFWLVYSASGVVWQLQRPAQPVGGLGSALVIGSAGFAFTAAEILFPHSTNSVHRGLDLLAFVAVYGVIGVSVYRARSQDLGALVAALALALGAVGTADTISSGSLTYVWAAEAAVLAWLARRIRDARFQVAALVYLGLALIHALSLDAPPSRLFVESGRPAAGGVSLLAAAAAAALVAAFTTRFPQTAERGLFRSVAPLLAAVRDRQQAVRVTGAAVAGVLAIDAASVGTLALYQLAWPGGTHNEFLHGEVGLTSLWAAAGLAAVAIGVRLRHRLVALGGLAWLGVTVLKVLAFDVDKIPRPLHAWPLLISGGTVLAASALVEARRVGLWSGPEIPILAVATSLGLAVGGAVTLVEGHVWRIDLDAVALFAVAAVYAALAAWFFPRERGRNYSTLLWVPALAVAGVADALLVGGEPRVLVWAGSGAALAWLAHAVRERRLVVAAWSYLVLATAVTLAQHATPAQLFVVREHPATGLASLLAAVAAIAIAAVALRVPAEPPRDRVDADLDHALSGLRSTSLWAAATLSVFAASLAILELAEWVGGGDPTSNFQGGHAGVSALWGILGLALLYVGLRRRQGAFRVGGFALFGVSLGKLFLYDLAWLSSIARALSFLAVGALLLLGGFFYQRLSAQLGERQKTA